MRRWIPILLLVTLAALSPAPIKDPRPLVKQPELSDQQRTLQQRGATMNEVGSVPADTEATAAPKIGGDADASDIVRNSKDPGGAYSSTQRGAAAIREASREIAQRERPNWGRLFFGGLIVVAAFGLFQVFRMWANKALPDAPSNYR